MPQIVEYVNREGITPTDRGTEARVQQGRRIGASFNQVAETLRNFGFRAGQELGGAIRDAGDAAVAWQDQRQIHQGATMAAGLFNNLELSQKEVINSIDPNDPAYSSKVDMALQAWRQNKLEPSLDQFTQGFSTERSQTWAEQHIAQIRQHFYTTNAAEVGRAASLGMKTGFDQTLTQLRNTVVQNPAALDTALNLWESSVKGIAGSTYGANPDDVANSQTTLLTAGKKHLTLEAAEEAIRRSPNPEATAQRFIKKYPDLIDGNQALKMGKDAARQARLDQSTERANRLYQNQLNNDNAKKATNDIFSKNVTIDPDTNKIVVNPNFAVEFNQLTTKFRNAPDAAPLQEKYLDWFENKNRQKKDIVEDKSDVVDRLYNGLFDEDNKTTREDIMTSSIYHQITPGTEANLLRLQTETSTNKDATKLYNQVTPAVRGLLGNDPRGNENYTKFAGTFFPVFAALPREQQIQALDLNNPNSLLSRMLEPYRRSPLEIDIAKKAMGLELSPETMEGIRNLGAAPAATPQAVPRQPARTIPPGAVQMLKNNPTMSSEFDQKYGRGEAAKILGTK